LKTLTLVSNNLSRRKGRAIVSSIGLILAIAVIVSTFTVSAAMQAQVGNEIDKYGPNIVVTPNSQSINVPYGSIMVGNTTIPENATDKIFTIPNRININVLSPKLYNQIQYKDSTILVVGVIPDKELIIKKWWNITGSLPRNDTNELLLGSALKTSIDLQEDDSMQIGNSSFIVTGTLDKTGSVDDFSIFMPLHTAQSLFGYEGQVSEIDVGALCNNCPVEVIAQQITDAVPDVKAVPIKQAVETRMQATQQTANFSLLLASIILVVGVASIMNTMLASVHERKKEIGVLMSLGASNIQLYKLFLSESAILGLVGGIVGALVGLLASLLIGPLLINIPVSFAEIPLFIIPICIGLAVGSSTIASLYPTWRAGKIDPVNSLKAI
jgi:putative ABC transport system permease protein